MPRRQDGGQCDLAERQHLPVARLFVGPERIVLPPIAGRRQTDDVRARLAAERRSQRRMIPVCVGGHDPADPAARSGENTAQMLRVVGPGVEDGDLGGAQEIGVRPGTGHESGVACDDAPDTGRHGDGGPHGEVGGHHDGVYFIKFFDSEARRSAQRWSFAANLSVSVNLIPF